MKISSHKDLVVWQVSMDLVTEIYEITKSLPSDEKYGLSSQMRRCAISIPSNIAEGARQGKVALNLKGFFFTPWDLVQNWKPNIFYQIE